MITLGITRLLTEHQEWIEGKSVGLLTNHTGVDENLIHTIELLKGFNLVALFSPEHGLWGAAQDGVKITNTQYRQNLEGGQDETDNLCNRPTLQVYSLYGSTPLNWTEILKNIDVIIYDIQDVGVRYYTYLGTLFETMKALENVIETGKCVECIVADRPNPIGGIHIEGPMLEPSYASLVGPYPIPVRYGLTIGEVAKLFHAEQGFTFPLKIAQTLGWDRNMWFDETGLLWVPPSPNMPTLETATLYPGTCLFEGTNLSEGRGTTKPFEHIGAPWIDNQKWLTRLNAKQFPGILFRPIVFTPQFSKYEGEVCNGVAIHITDKKQVSPIELTVWMLSTLGDEFPHDFKLWEAHFDRLAGSDALRNALLVGTSVEKITEEWSAGIREFRERREPYLLY
ncbi:DUF1343 domain-containing protein [Candidatus Poribacteria bacterium]|nr:DUF1343 domain-containing protein [Candidatus Poribacteria bacterium]MYB65090.1 DUF1343 domain-containing protein [Candidatus Poribacteria bacterium]MYF56359.1 DUF1343 domain-containing protein [Candidatus Poribacteria bacterium]MYI95003.1 DUF1343 domain-containing protein [Candidatus Poribacteria bacterium]